MVFLCLNCFTFLSETLSSIKDLKKGLGPLATSGLGNEVLRGPRPYFSDIKQYRRGLIVVSCNIVAYVVILSIIAASGISGKWTNENCAWCVKESACQSLSGLLFYIYRCSKRVLNLYHVLDVIFSLSASSINHIRYLPKLKSYRWHYDHDSSVYMSNNSNTHKVAQLPKTLLLNTNF